MTFTLNSIIFVVVVRSRNCFSVDDEQSSSAAYFNIQLEFSVEVIKSVEIVT